MPSSSTEPLQNKSASPDLQKPKNELYPASEETNAPTKSEQTAQYPNRKGKGEFSLNFDDADLGEVAKVILSDILAQNYVLNPKVVGKVTLQTTNPLSKEALLPTLEMILSMNNAALIKEGAMYKIEPANEALYSADFAFGRAGKIGYQMRVIPIKNVAVENIADLIKPLLHEKTVLNIDSKRNLLVVSGGGR
jgi:general secretion pathway protein D